MPPLLGSELNVTGRPDVAAAEIVYAEPPTTASAGGVDVKTIACASCDGAGTGVGCGAGNGAGRGATGVVGGGACGCFGVVTLASGGKAGCDEDGGALDASGGDATGAGGAGGAGGAAPAAPAFAAPAASDVPSTCRRESSGIASAANFALCCARASAGERLVREFVGRSSMPRSALCSEIETPESALPPSPGMRCRPGIASATHIAQATVPTASCASERNAARGRLGETSRSTMRRS